MLELCKPPLWPQQAEALEWLDGRRAAALHIPMGGGKTRIVVEFVARRRFRRILVVCPKAVGPVWDAEFRRWWPDQSPPFLLDLTDGPIRHRAARLRAAPAPFVAVVNYDAFWRGDLGDAIRSAALDLVVYDEAHRLKDPGGRASLFAARLRPRVPCRLALTGTPMPHSPLDIYAQFRALDLDVFGNSFVRFRARYAVLGGFEGRQVVAYQNLDDLARRIRTLAFVVEPAALQRPAEADQRRYCLLEPTARAVYRRLERDLVADVGAGVVTAANALVRLLRLQQLTSGVLATEDGRHVRVSRAKEELLTDLLADLPPDEPVVVFGRFRQDLDAVHRTAHRLGRGSAELSGRTNQLAEWQRPDGPPILAAQLQAGSLGVSMVRAAYAVFYSLGFSLGDYLQARARLARPGQTRPVTFIHLVARGTIDELVLQALEARAEVVDHVLKLIREASHARPA